MSEPEDRNNMAVRVSQKARITTYQSDFTTVNTDFMNRLGIGEEGAEPLKSPQERESEAEKENKILKIKIEEATEALERANRRADRYKRTPHASIRFDVDGINNMTFRNKTFHGDSWSIPDFYGCRFIDCHFDWEACTSDFKSCKFTRCTFNGDWTRARFEECSMTNVKGEREYGNCVLSYRILNDLNPYRTIEYFEKRGFEFDKAGIPRLD